MPHIQVKTLHEKALTVVVHDLKRKVDNHQETCAICHWPHHVEYCPTMVKLKEQFADLPTCIVNSVYMKFEQCYLQHSLREKIIDFMYIYCWLLENPELSISFSFYKYEDKDFAVKYGKYVRSIDFDLKATVNNGSRNNYFDGEFWKTVLRSARNVQSMNLFGCWTTAELLEHIGRECVQIKQVNGLSIQRDTTVEIFKKLCFYEFQNAEIKNKCCATLQRFDLSYFSGLDNDRVHKIREIVPILLQYMPNLKYLGGGFHVDYYLRSVVTTGEISETSLETIYIHEGTEDILHLLHKFCPKMNFLIVSSAFNTGFEHLHQYFPNLEILKVYSNTGEYAPIYKILVSSVWPSLKTVDIVSRSLDIELSDFARNLPKLEVLEIKGCKVRWNRKMSFKFLETVKFELIELKDLRWISSFAQTVRDLKISFSFSDGGLNKDICSPLLTVSLPYLKYLSLFDLEYDYNFITRVISVCESLQRFWIFNLIEENLLDDIVQFVKDNNYNCELFY